MANGKSKRALVKKADEAIMPISIEDVQDKIIVLRGEPVILDRDVAALYGVQTKEINQAVKNNPGKFPIGYVLPVEEEEMEELVKNFDRFNILKHSTITPKAFTGVEFRSVEGKAYHQAQEEMKPLQIVTL